MKLQFEDNISSLEHKLLSHTFTGILKNIKFIFPVIEGNGKLMEK